VATAGPVDLRVAMELTQTLRRKGLRSALDLERRSLKGQMRQANKDRFRYSLILGADELARGQVTLKDMVGGAQHEIPLAETADRLTHLPEREIV
jgi:histidyl-tRNA synthetase